MFNPAEKERLLSARLKRDLEKAGYLVKKSMDGTVTVLDGKTKALYISGISVQDAGRLFGLWGNEALTDQEAAENAREAKITGRWKKPPDIDQQTGLDTPETAAVREKC